MKYIRLIFLISITTVTSACQPQSNDNSAQQQSKVILDELASDYPALSAAVFYKDISIWSYHHGFTDIRQAEGVTAETKFLGYSTAKALTGLALGRLIDDGKVKLDDRLGDIAPDLPAVFHPIRLQDILSHQSGIRHYQSPQDWLNFANQRCETPDDALRYFSKDPLIAEPGTEEHYSSFAFVLGSAVLTRITGHQNFEQALNRTLGPWADFQLDSPQVTKAQPFIKAGLLPQRPKDLSPNDVIPIPPLNHACKFGAGGLVFSAQDLAYAGALLNQGRILPKSTFNYWEDGSDIIYGAAYNDISSIWQLSGGAPGGRSYLLVNLKSEISIAIMGNIDGPNMGASARALEKIWTRFSSNTPDY